MNQLPPPDQGGDSRHNDRPEKPDGKPADKVGTADLGRFTSSPYPSVSRNMLHYLAVCTESDPALRAWHLDQIYDDTKDNLNDLDRNLSEIFYDDPDPKVRASALHALYRVEAPSLKACLHEALLHPAAELVHSAVEILRDHKDLIPQLRDSLKTALQIEVEQGVWDSPTTSMRVTEILKLCKFNDRVARALRKEVVELVLRFDQIPIELSADILERANPKKSIKELIRCMLFSEESEVVRDRAERALKYFSKEYDPFIVNQMHGPLSNKNLRDTSVVSRVLEVQINLRGQANTLAVVNLWKRLPDELKGLASDCFDFLAEKDPNASISLNQLLMEGPSEMQALAAGALCRRISAEQDTNALLKALPFVENQDVVFMMQTAIETEIYDGNPRIDDNTGRLISELINSTQTNLVAFGLKLAGLFNPEQHAELISKTVEAFIQRTNCPVLASAAADALANLETDNAASILLELKADPSLPPFALSAVNQAIRDLLGMS